jgi:hypothetical protein
LWGLATLAAVTVPSGSGSSSVALWDDYLRRPQRSYRTRRFRNRQRPSCQNPLCVNHYSCFQYITNIEELIASTSSIDNKSARVYMTFKRYRGVYFYSLLVASIGIVPYGIGNIVHFDGTDNWAWSARICK